MNDLRIHSTLAKIIEIDLNDLFALIILLSLFLTRLSSSNQLITHQPILQKTV